MVERINILVGNKAPTEIASACMEAIQLSVAGAPHLNLGG